MFFKETSLTIQIPPISAKPLSILVADDHSTNRLLAEQYLLKLGHTVDCVCDGIEAMNALKVRQYDVIFMDCEMPNMNGYAATAKIFEVYESYEGESRPWIIALTGSSSDEDRDLCKSVGMDDFVPKPFNMLILAEALGRMKPRPKKNHEERKDDHMIFDLKQMERHFAGDEDIRDKFVADFVASYARYIANIESGISSGNVEAVRIGAHTLKGVVANFFSKQIHGDLSALEAMAKQASLQGAEQLFAQIKNDLNLLLGELQKLNVTKAA